jgi:UDP-N-acetylmuramyl pentapeptide phosphotransferase/UDP-N-acetylglucosamine-1-phosphate transferase
MFLPSIFIFSIALFVTWGVYLVLGKKYALDQPGSRKQHHHPVPQIGGLVFGPLFLLFVWRFGITPT